MSDSDRTIGCWGVLNKYLDKFGSKFMIDLAEVLFGFSLEIMIDYPNKIKKLKIVWHDNPSYLTKAYRVAWIETLLHRDYKLDPTNRSTNDTLTEVAYGKIETGLRPAWFVG